MTKGYREQQQLTNTLREQQRRGWLRATLDRVGPTGAAAHKATAANRTWTRANQANAAAGRGQAYYSTAGVYTNKADDPIGSIRSGLGVAKMRKRGAGKVSRKKRP